MLKKVYQITQTALTNLSKAYFAEQSILTQKRSDNDTIELIPKNHCKQNDKSKTLIWLHGLGDSAYGFLDLFNTEHSPLDSVKKNSIIILKKDTKIVLLTAPILKVTINEGMQMTAWYDIKSLDRLDEKAYSREDVLNSAQIINKIVEKELENIKEEKQLFIGGFSQGCSMALHMGLESKINFGAVFGFSGYLFKEANIEKIEKGLPVLLCHGKDDLMIPCKSAMESYERIKNFKNVWIQPVTDLGHSMCLEEIQLFKGFYQKVTGNENKKI